MGAGGSEEGCRGTRSALADSGDGYESTGRTIGVSVGVLTPEAFRAAMAALMSFTLFRTTSLAVSIVRRMVTHSFILTISGSSSKSSSRSFSSNTARSSWYLFNHAWSRSSGCSSSFDELVEGPLPTRFRGIRGPGERAVEEDEDELGYVGVMVCVNLSLFTTATAFHDQYRTGEEGGESLTFTPTHTGEWSRGCLLRCFGTSGFDSGLRVSKYIVETSTYILSRT